MLDKFFEGLGGKLAEKWVVTILTPAFVFWLGGLAAYVWQFGLNPARTWFLNQPQPVQLIVLVVGLLIVTTSAVVVNFLDLFVLRMLEGYWPRWIWPLNSLRRRLVQRQASRLSTAEQRFQDLASKGLDQLSADERDEYAALDLRLMQAPALPDRLMPTTLGNILRSAELRPTDKYGLDVLICWPRLWLLLPDSAKSELTQARSTLDTAACVWCWSLLFLVWTIMAWWAAPIAVLSLVFTYRSMQSAAQVYGSLLESSFDLYRVALYESLRWPPPSNPAVERQLGEELTLYLWRGSDKHFPLFTGTESLEKESSAV